MVFHVSKMVTATLLIPVPFEKPLFVFKLQRNSEHDKQLIHDLLVHVLGEALNGRQVALDDIRVRSIAVLGNKFRNIVDFKIVLDARYQVACSDWLPTIVIASFQVRSVFQSCFFWKRQYRLPQSKLCVDLISAQTMVLDVKEAL